MRIARLVMALGLLAASIALLLAPEPTPAPPVEDWRAEFRAPPAPGELRLLFVGNSFVARNDLPGMVAELLRVGGVAEAVRTHMLAPSGGQLHEQAGRAELAEDISALGWDAVVLQDFSTAPLFGSDSARSAEAIGRLVDLSAEAGAESVLFATWPRREGHALYAQDFDDYAAPRGPGEMTEIVHAHYAGIAERSDAILAPVGRVWRTAREVLPGIRLFAEDGFHAAPAGTYLAALVVARSLGLDPRAADWAPGSVDPGEAGQLRMLVASTPG